MNKEKISILITNFNKEKFIEECILSCLSQNYNNLEIIIVDNSSTDKSMSKIKKYSNELFAIKKKRDSQYSPKNQIDSLIEAFKKSTVVSIDAIRFATDRRLSGRKIAYLADPIRKQNTSTSLDASKTAAAKTVKKPNPTKKKKVVSDDDW